MTDRELTLIEHLAELRKRIIISLTALIISTVLSFPLASAVLDFLKLPSLGLIEKLVFFSPQEAFSIYMRLAFFSGLVISMPVLLYQLWAFLLPAVKESLKRHIVYFILFSFIAFVLGCLFAFFILIPPALRFLLSFGKGQLEPIISASNYISFVSALVIAGGFVFQMPILMFILTKLGIINHRVLRRQYKYAIIVIFIVASIITPTTDIFNMMILAGPMILLYEISIWVSFLAIGRRKNP